MRVVLPSELFELSEQISAARTDEYSFDAGELHLINGVNMSIDALQKHSRSAFRVRAQEAVVIPNILQGDQITIGKANDTVERFACLLSGSPFNATNPSLDRYGLWLPYEKTDRTVNGEYLGSVAVYLKVTRELVIEADPVQVPTVNTQNVNMLGVWPSGNLR